MMRQLAALLGMLSAGCSDDGLTTNSASSSTASGSTGPAKESVSASETGATPTTGPAGVTTTSPTTATTDGIDNTSTSTTEASDPTSEASTSNETGTSTSGGVPSCEQPCADPWVHQGTLQIVPATDPASLACLVEVTGELLIDVGPTLPPQLASLRRVGENLQIQSPTLTSLAGLDCLEEIGNDLQLFQATALADISALAELKQLTGLALVGNSVLTDLSPLDGVAGLHDFDIRDATAVTRLPVPGPGSELWRLRLWGNHALTDLDALAGVPGDSHDLKVEILDHHALISVAGLSALWPAEPNVLSVELSSLPALTSLAGLEAVDNAYLVLRHLPLIDDLGPLAGLENLGGLSLDGMPKLTSLAPLAGLRHLDSLRLGSCTKNGGVGLDALKSAAPLAGLETLSTLSIARNAVLTTLPPLGGLMFPPSYIEVIDNPKITAMQASEYVANGEPPSCAEPPQMCNCDEDAPMP